MQTKSLDALVQELPQPLLDEVRDFVEFPMTKQTRTRVRRANGRTRAASKFLRQDWADALSEFREQHTALELQKQAWISGESEGG